MAKKPANKANKPFRTRDIMIAAILAVCLLASVGIMILIQSSVGKPVFYDGDIQNICLRINEICTKNRSIIPDPNGEFSDYIEIYNYGDEVLLEGFGLATEKGSVARYTFGDVRIAKDEYKIIYLDGKEVPFRLSSSGKEYIGLLAPDGSVIDSVETVAMLADEVMIYTDTGFFVSEEASPGLPNTKEGVEAFRKGQADESPDIVINEILTDNCSALPDFEGEFVDIIEILNVSGKTVSTAGYFISDSLEKRNRSALPDRNLEPGEIMLIFASGKETVADNGEFHTDFGLSSGETVVLSKGGKYVCVGVKRCGTNMSLSRVRNEDGEFVYEVMRTTVGFPNDESGMEALAESMIDRTLPIVINEVLLASDETAYGGKIRDVVELCNISGGTVSTKGWHLSDSEKDPCRYELPERELAPGEILVIYADDYGTEVSTGFALSSGDSVYLTSPSGKRGDAVECMPAGRGKSWSLSSRDASGFGYTSGAISIGHANDSAGALSYDKDARPATVEISEAVSVNTKYLAGSYGTYTDFVELHNNSDKEIDLSGWYLSDDAEKPRKGSLDGLKIPAGGYKIVLLSKETKNVRKGYLILNFAISLHGETLVLSHGDEVVDTMPVPALGENTAFGRADGYDGFSILDSPTPGAKNGKPVGGYTAVPTASVEQGVYNDVSALSVELTGEGTIYYTLDCEDPTKSGRQYQGPITVNKTTVIRCYAVAAGKQKSDTVDLSYIINENDELETVSLVTTPANLFDYYTGIYEKGPNVSSSDPFPYEKANFFKDWEREASISLFPYEGEGFSIDCGIKIFGGYSRALEKKSFACFFRSKYGAGSLDYSVFGEDGLDSFESIILRNTGQDATKSNMRDAMLAEVVSDMTDVDVQASRPIVLYINGEFWGVYFIREKVNENYVAGHQNVKKSQAKVDYASGTRTPEYTELISYVKSHSLAATENYNYVAARVDIDEYTDYIIAEICMANTDNGNIKFGKAEGGKWRWIMYDVDQSFRNSADKTISEHLNPNGTGSGNRFPTTLINALLKNSSYKEKFLKRFAWQMNNIWTPEHILPYIDKYENLIAHDIKKDCKKYGRTYENWQSHVESLRKFINNRGENLRSQVKSYFNLSDSDMKKYGF